MKPAIGLDCDLALRTTRKRQRLEVYRDYVHSVELAGGVPVLLPVIDDPMLVDDQLDLVDGLVLVGGRDLAPKVYGAAKHPKTKPMHPSRQLYDIELARAAIRRGIPILGICGGLQLVNVVCGGDLIQHVPDVAGRKTVHRKKSDFAVHNVTIEPKTKLARVVAAHRMRVNSGHHQAVGRVGGGLRVAARSADGVIEALESRGKAFILCVQWHPERLAAGSARHLALFEALVEASRSGMDVA